MPARSATRSVFLASAGALALGVVACRDAPPPPPNVTPPPALAIDEATRALAKDPKFDQFRSGVRDLRKLSAEYATLRQALKSGGSAAQRQRFDELGGLIASGVSALNEAMSAPGVGEADAKAMRYLFAASDAELGG